MAKENRETTAQASNHSDAQRVRYSVATAGEQEWCETEGEQLKLLYNRDLTCVGGAQHHDTLQRIHEAERRRRYVP